MKKDLISVIIPVYNVAAYLPACIDSVLKQDNSMLEVILVDDGSTDGSGAVCDSYAAMDSRVRVVHQTNSGAAAAKNTALRMAEGEYLSFVDSDDYLEPDAYRYMLAQMKKENVDVVQCAFRDVYQNRCEDQILHPGRTVLDNKEYLLRFPKDWTCALLWNKLYKRRLYDGVFFEEGHKIDDEYFTYRGFLKECRILLDDRVVYNYRRRASSVMASPEAGEQRVLDCLDATVKRRAAVVEVYPELKKYFDENYLDAIWYLSENPGSTEHTIDVLKSHLRNYFRQKGNSIPPRYLWPLLFKMYMTRTAVLAQRCRQKQGQQDVDSYFP